MALGALGLGALILDTEGNCLAANSKMREILQLPESSIVDKPFREIVEPADDKEEADNRQRLLAEQINSYSATHILQLGNSQTKILRTGFGLLQGSSKEDRAVLVIVQDITAVNDADLKSRRLAGAILNAIEAERSRIARELHDDIGLSLSLLVLQIMRAGKPVSNEPGRKHADIPELCDSVRKISARVSHLSHQLHSPVLEYVGLTKAVEATCREFMDEHKIQIECSCEAVPATLDGKIGLCCLRVVQEALNNIRKHSHAHKGSVFLKGKGDQLLLEIADDGIGFNLQEAELARGIGLLSMRERVRLIGGELTITSKTGQGTRITAHIPLAQ